MVYGVYVSMSCVLYLCTHSKGMQRPCSTMYVHMHVMSHDQTLSGDPNMNPAKDKTLEQGFCIAPKKVTKSDENEILTLSAVCSAHGGPAPLYPISHT